MASLRRLVASTRGPLSSFDSERPVQTSRMSCKEADVVSKSDQTLQGKAKEGSKQQSSTITLRQRPAGTPLPIPGSQSFPFFCLVPVSPYELTEFFSRSSRILFFFVLFFASNLASFFLFFFGVFEVFFPCKQRGQYHETNLYRLAPSLQVKLGPRPPLGDAVLDALPCTHACT